MGLKPAIAPQAEVTSAAVLDLHEWHRRTSSEGDVPAQNLSVQDRADMERRFVIIEPLLFHERFPDLWRDCGGRRLEVAGRIASERGCKMRTLRHWVMNYRRHGLMGLVNRDRDDKGTFPSLNRAARNQILRLITPERGVFGALSVSETWRAYDDERVWREEWIGKLLHGPAAEKYARYLDEDGKLSEKARLPKISSMTVRRFVETIPEAVRTLARDGEETYRNTQEIISHRAISELEPLEYCVLDHRKLDVFTMLQERGGWRLIRPWITAAVDFRTRRWLAWGLFEVPSSDSIASILKKLFIEHGVPPNCYIDNGRDFICEYLQGKHVRKKQTGPLGELDPAWRGVLGTLGVRVIRAIPYNARAKIIEPLFKRISNFDRVLPEWCGSRPSERPESFDAMVEQHEAWLRGEQPKSPFRTVQEIAALYDAAIADLNERPLQGEGMEKRTPTGIGWMTPAECWDSLISGVERRTVRTEDLHVVFTKRRTLTVKHGEICSTFGGRKYYYRIEGEPLQLMALNGQLVEVAFDPNELGQVAIYWKDRFVALAHNVMLRKMGEDLFVEDERNRRAARREIRKAIAQVHEQIPGTGPEERLARRREILPARQAHYGAETPIELPAPLGEAAAAFRAESEARFADVEIIHVERIERPADEDDGHFSFFGEAEAK